MAAPTDKGAEPFRGRHAGESPGLLTRLAGRPGLQPGEKIRITVFNEPTLSGDYEIDQSGFISLPLAGTLKALCIECGFHRFLDELATPPRQERLLWSDAEADDGKTL